MTRNPNRRMMVLAVLLGTVGFASAGGTAFADQHGDRREHGWQRHGWHHREDGRDWRGGYAGPPGYYPPPPPVYYAPPPPPPPPVYYAPPPPAYYGPPSLSFGINVPLNR